jgi:hypothetical protein
LEGEIESWIFFGVNLLFTGFNAWVAWQNWRRADAADRPALSVSLQRSREVDAAELEIVTRNGTTVPWRAVSAELLKPRMKALHYPLVHMVQDETGQEIPRYFDVSPERAAYFSPLTGRPQPGSQAREILWITGLQSGQQVKLRLTYESSEPQPRRYVATVIRTAPTLTSVMHT